MSARAALANATSAGVRIRVIDGNLSLRGDELAISQILSEVRANKTEILVLLAGNDAALPKELNELIDRVAMVHGFADHETREAKQIAAGDVDNALTCFRSLAKRTMSRLDLPQDDRVVCSDCGNLVRGQCQAAANGLMTDTYRGYSPVPDVPRNCEHYIAKPVRRPN